ncbi:LysM domain/BON superfamily protein [compost metagenome]
MGMFDFIKEAGEKLFGKGEAKAAQEAAKADASAEKVEAANRAAGDAIEAYAAQEAAKADASQRRWRPPTAPPATPSRPTSSRWGSTPPG